MTQMPGPGQGFPPPPGPSRSGLQQPGQVPPPGYPRRSQNPPYAPQSPYQPQSPYAPQAPIPARPTLQRPPPSPGVGTDTRRTVGLVLGSLVGVIVIIVAITSVILVRAGQARRADFTGSPVSVSLKDFQGQGTLTLQRVEYVSAGQHESSHFDGIVLLYVTFTGADGELSYNPLLFKIDAGGTTYRGTAGYSRQDHLSAGDLAPGKSVTGTVGFDAPRGSYTVTYRPIGGKAVTFTLTV